MPTPSPLYQTLAQIVDARLRCLTTANSEWADRHEERICTLVREHMPSGGGFDAATTIDLDKSTGERLVFNTSFHHMDEHGGYDGWTEHTVTIKPSLSFDFHVTVSGTNRNTIKDYIGETFNHALSTPVTEGKKEAA